MQFFGGQGGGRGSALQGTPEPFACAHVRMRTRLRTFTRGHTHARTRTHVHAHGDKHARAHVRALARGHAHARICTHVRTMHTARLRGTCRMHYNPRTHAQEVQGRMCVHQAAQAERRHHLRACGNAADSCNSCLSREKPQARRPASQASILAADVVGALTAAAPSPLRASSRTR